jgi:hypothetical protein
MTFEQRAALDDVADDDLMVDRADLAAALHQPPEAGFMSTERLAVYLVLTIAVTVLAAIVWSSVH